MTKWLKRHPMSGWKWYYGVVFCLLICGFEGIGLTLIELLWRPIRPVADTVESAVLCGVVMAGTYYILARKRIALTAAAR